MAPEQMADWSAHQSHAFDRRDLAQGLLALHRGWLSPNKFQELFSHPKRSPHYDLCALLQEATQLSQNQVSELRSKQTPHPNLDQQRFQRLLGSFEVTEQLHRDSHRLSYRARHKCFRSTVAIQYFRQGSLLTRACLDAFATRLMTLKTLGHPGLAHIYDVLRLPKELVLVRNYIKGHNLHDFLAKSPALNFHQALRLAISCATALTTAHIHGITHGRLSPENLIIHRRDPIITDFAPGEASPALDIFCFGKVLEQLFPNTSSRSMRRIIERCLQGMPSHRFGSMADLLEALLHLEKGHFQGPERWLRGLWQGFRYLRGR